MSYPFTLLIKPTGPDCNITCKYCFYCRKSAYYGNKQHRMSPETQDLLTRQYLELNLPQSSFAFQGGEPTLMGLEFYQKQVELQKKYGNANQIIINSLQTNAILIDDLWASFFAKNDFLLGISIDGPEKYHDHFRVDHAGSGTHAKVINGIECCKANGVEYNLLTLLNSYNADNPDEIFDFLIEQGTDYLQFIPCIEKNEDFEEEFHSRANKAITNFSVSPEQYGRFMCRIFDRWKEYGPSKLHIRLFDSIMMKFTQGVQAECTFSPKCADYVVVEHNGDVFCCDFFVDDESHLGNIHKKHINDLANSTQKREFNRRKRKLAPKCNVCRHLEMCRGGCPKDRLAAGGYNYPSYLCEGYKIFFDYALAELQEIAYKISSGNI